MPRVSDIATTPTTTRVESTYQSPPHHDDDDSATSRSASSGDELAVTPRPSSRAARGRGACRVGKPLNAEVSESMLAEAAAAAAGVSSSDLGKVRRNRTAHDSEDDDDSIHDQYESGRTSGRGRSASKARRDSSSGAANASGRRPPTTMLSMTNPRLPTSRIASSEAVRAAVIKAAQLTPVQPEDEFDDDEDGDSSALRKQRNKFSASQYRKRRKVFVELLEEKVAELEFQLKEAQRQAQQLEQENKQLQMLQRLNASRDLAMTRGMADHANAARMPHHVYAPVTHPMTAHPSFPLNLPLHPEAVAAAVHHQQVLASRVVPQAIDMHAHAQPSPIDAMRLQNSKLPTVPTGHFQIPAVHTTSTTTSHTTSASASTSTSTATSPRSDSQPQQVVQGSEMHGQSQASTQIEMVNIARSASITDMDQPPTALNMLNITLDTNHLPTSAPMNAGLSRTISQESHDSHVGSQPQSQDGMSSQHGLQSGSDSPSSSSVASGLTSVFSTKTQIGDLTVNSTTQQNMMLAGGYQMDTLVLPSYLPSLSNGGDAIDAGLGSLEAKADGLLPMQRQSSVLPFPLPGFQTMPNALPSQHAYFPIHPLPNGMQYAYSQGMHVPYQPTAAAASMFNKIDSSSMHLPHHPLMAMGIPAPAVHKDSMKTNMDSFVESQSAPTSSANSPTNTSTAPPTASFGLVMFCMFACVMMMAVPASEWALATSLGVSSVTATLLESNFVNSHLDANSAVTTTPSSSNRLVKPTGYGRVMLSFDPRQPASTWSYQPSTTADDTPGTDHYLFNLMHSDNQRATASDISSLVNEITKGKPDDLTTNDFMFELFKRIFWTQLESALARGLRALQLGAALCFALLNTLFGQICLALSLLVVIYTVFNFACTRVKPIVHYVLQPPQVESVTVKSKA